MQAQQSVSKQELDARVQDIVKQAKEHGAVKNSIEFKKSLNRQSVLPGKKRESYAERRMREKKEQKDNAEVQSLLNEVLDLNAPVNNAMRYVEDAKTLTDQVTNLAQNQGVQASLSKLDELASTGDEQAQELADRVQVSIKAFQNDMENSIAMSADLMSRVGVLSTLSQGKEKIDGVTLRAASELDAQTSAANWSLVTMYGTSSQELLANLDEVVNYAKPHIATEQETADAVDVNVITDAVVKE